MAPLTSNPRRRVASVTLVLLCAIGLGLHVSSSADESPSADASPPPDTTPPPVPAVAVAPAPMPESHPLPSESTLIDARADQLRAQVAQFESDMGRTLVATCRLSDDPFPRLAGSARTDDRGASLGSTLAKGHDMMVFGDVEEGVASITGTVHFQGFAEASFSLRPVGDSWECEDVVTLVPADRIITGTVVGRPGKALITMVKGSCGTALIEDDGSFLMEASSDDCVVRAETLDGAARRHLSHEVFVAASDDVEVDVGTLRFPPDEPRRVRVPTSWDPVPSPSEANQSSD